MVEFSPDELPDLDTKVELAEKVRLEILRRGKTRAGAIEHGRLLGTDEARRRNEEKEWADSRIARAMAYAAWEWDGKPIGKGSDYRKEFGLPEPAVSDPRISLGSDFVVKRER